MKIVSENFTLFESGTLCVDVRNATDSEIDTVMSVLVSEGVRRKAEDELSITYEAIFGKPKPIEDAPENRT